MVAQLHVLGLPYFHEIYSLALELRERSRQPRGADTGALNSIYVSAKRRQREDAKILVADVIEVPEL